jgi:hypothetical protein
MVLYCCGDLLWASKIKSTGEAIGVGCRPARNREMLAARLADSPVKAVLVDLTSEHCWDLMEALRGAGAGPAERGLKVVCFGPHVEVDAMKRAAGMGADSVLSRGALSGNLPGVLTTLEAGDAVRSQLND